MKSIYVILFLLIISTKGFSQSDIEIKKPEYKRVGEAFGYVLGQEFTLNRLKKDFPDYTLQIKKAEIEFNSSFGHARENMVYYLKNIFGDKFGDFENALKGELGKTLNSQKIDNSDALQFITEVEDRAKGKIASPVLETLLSFQYRDKPERELSSGSTKVFKTKGHPKAKNTDWQINVPVSWYQKEASRPNIIQTFTSEYGDGLELVSLMVKDLDLPKGYKPTQSELAEIFSEAIQRKSIPAGSKFLSYKRVTLDNNTGGMLEFEQTAERVDTTSKLRMLQFSFYRLNKMYMLQCMVIGKADEDLTSRWQKFLPLFKLIANSIVVNDQYK